MRLHSGADIERLAGELIARACAQSDPRIASNYAVHRVGGVAVVLFGDDRARQCGTAWDTAVRGQQAQYWSRG
jgi:hypothetical protein